LVIAALSAAQAGARSATSCTGRSTEFGVGTILPSGDFGGQVFVNISDVGGFPDGVISGHIELHPTASPTLFLLTGRLDFSDDISPNTGRITGTLDESTGRFRLKGTLIGHNQNRKRTTFFEGHGFVNLVTGVFSGDVHRTECDTITI
jgi:hypothetical protein